MRILHTNDLHGKLPDVVDRLRPLRAEADLYLDSGDLVRTGNVSIPMAADPSWPLLAELRCDAFCPGNRDVHFWGVGMEAKHRGRETPAVCANLVRKNGERVFPGSVVLVREGLRIGIVGTMVRMVTESMRVAGISGFLWTGRVAAAVEEAARIREGVDVLFALTHIGATRDRELAKTGVFDAIFGGHSHTVLEPPERIGRTWIAQGGMHGRYAGVYEWTDGELRGRPVALR